MDHSRIDSHKLMFHPERVARWQRGEIVPPLYMEVSPSGACNHRCSFCGLDFMGYKPSFLDSAMLRQRLEELGRYGLRSIMFAGEGEPFLHRDMPELARHTKQSGIDVAFTTNAVLLTPEKAKEVLPVTSWIKVSCNAGTPETYAQVHGTQAGDFARVMDNLAAAVELRRREGHACTLGLQILLLPEVRGEVEALALRCRDIGLDYLVVKPYSQHPQSKTRRYEGLPCDAQGAALAELAGRVTALATPSFKVVFRLRGMQKVSEGTRPYDRCLGLPFWSYMDARGNIWGCSVFLGDERFLYGNVYEQGFQEIWEGPRRKASLDFVARELDASTCRAGCRMDEVNRYLWELAHPHPHVNFI